MKTLTFFFVLLLIAAEVTPVQASTSDELRLEIENAFVRVQGAERNGGNVTLLVAELNKAAVLLDAGGEENLTQASVYIQWVKAATPLVNSEGTRNNSLRLTLTVASLVVLGILGVLVLTQGSKIYWRLWLRFHGGWKVERT